MLWPPNENPLEAGAAGAALPVFDGALPKLNGAVEEGVDPCVDGADGCAWPNSEPPLAGAFADLPKPAKRLVGGAVAGVVVCCAAFPVVLAADGPAAGPPKVKDVGGLDAGVIAGLPPPPNSPPLDGALEPAPPPNEKELLPVVVAPVEPPIVWPEPLPPKEGNELLCWVLFVVPGVPNEKVGLLG